MPSRRAYTGSRATPRAFLEAERVDLLERLNSRQVAVRRHTLLAILGVSPSVLLPAVGTFGDGGVVALALIILLMIGLESTRAVRAKRDVAELKRALIRLEEELDSISPDP